MASGSQNNTSFQAQKWTNLRAFTIGNTAKDVDGTAAVSWSKNEILGASDSTKFYRGDKTWSNTLTSTLILDNGSINGELLRLVGVNDKTFSFKLTSPSGQTDATNVDIGWDWAAGDGAGAAFRSALFPNQPGYFVIYARTNTTDEYTLVGKTDGTLTWTGKIIPNTGNTTGTVGGANGPVYVNGGVITACTTYANATVGKANQLTTARAINGTNFDGSAAITTANWGTARNITIKDSSSTNAGTAVSVNGSAAVTLLLPATIKASITGNCSGSSGSCTGNAATATKFNSNRTIKLTGSVTGSATTNGESGWEIATTTNHTHNKVVLVASNTAFTDTATVALNGLSIRWYSTASSFSGQPTQYGFLVTMATGDSANENHQIFATQSNGDLYHRGTNGSSHASPPAFKTIIDSSNWYRQIFTNKNETRDTLTVTYSTWAVTSGVDLFGLAFKDSGLKYTPSGGSATVSTDSGDWRAWLTCASNSNTVELNMRIDGSWQAGKFIGPLQGNADTATKATQDSDGNTIKSTYLKLSGGTMTGSMKFSKDSPLTFIYTAGTETPVLVLNSAVNYGIRYKEGTPDTLKLSASGNANTDDADLCINGNGDGTVTIRGNTILHAGNYTSYTVTKTGSGASGSWGISVTGSSGSCTGNAASASQCSSAALTDIALTWSSSYSTGSWMLIYNGEKGSNGGALFRAINQANTAAWVDGAHKWVRIGGDTMTGALTFANNTLNNIGDDCAMGDQNVAGALCIKGLNGNTTLRFIQKGGTASKDITFDGTTLTVNGNCTGNAATATTASACSGNALTCSYPYGFASKTDNATWGNTTGTSIVSWNDSTGGSIAFRRDNPSSGKMSIKVDGRFYGNEGTYPAMLMNYTNSYWGMGDPDAGSSGWIRTTSAGIIPYQSGSKGSGHCGIGTSSWYFSTAYIDTITSNKTYGAVWNDIAECRKTITKEPGRVVIENKSGIMELSSIRMQATGRIISDTYGYCMGEPANDGTPIAIAGRVLVYPYRRSEEYNLGDCVCAAPNGTVDIMTREEIKEYPDRIIGIVSEIPNYKIWSGGAQNGNDDIEVNDRIWIYVH